MSAVFFLRYKVPQIETLFACNNFYQGELKISPHVGTGLGDICIFMRW